MAENSRNTDPKSSHEAERNMDKGGTREKQIAMALQLVQRHPGSTTWELAFIVHNDPEKAFRLNEILHRRLPDLYRRGQAFPKRTRRCTRKGRKMQEWCPNR